MNDDNIPDPCPTDVRVRVPAQAGMPVGHYGTAGMDKTGPNVVIVAIPRWRLIMEEVGYFFVKSWVGITTTDAPVSALVAQMSGGGYVFHSVPEYLSRTTMLAAGATLIALATRLYIWWQESRRRRGLAL